MTYFAYVSPKKFGSFLLPVSHQNQLLRLRANELNFGFGLGVGELVIETSYLGLFETIRLSSDGDCIGCCSIQMMPIDQRLNYLQDLILKKHLKMDFLFEFKGPTSNVREAVKNNAWESKIGRH